MNQENRQKVLDYLSKHDIYPIYFNNYESNKDEFDPLKFSIKSMIIRVLELSRDYSSYNSVTKIFETSSGRWRSSLDIWRHIIYYFPTVEIFDVMHELYNFYHVKGGFSGQFCTDIDRRTFALIYNCGIDYTNYMSQSYLSKLGILYDEYKLDWEDWKDI